MRGFACAVAEHLDLSPLGPGVERPRESSTVESGERYLLVRHTHDKFPQDKIAVDDERYLVVIEGVVFNYDELGADRSPRHRARKVAELYEAEGDGFCDALHGEFSGLLHDKERDAWVIFTNHTTTRPVYYFHHEDCFIAATSCFWVLEWMKALGFRPALDVTGCYFLLTYGYMLADFTLFEEVRKLRAGCYLVLEGGRITEHRYIDYDATVDVGSTRREIFDDLDALFEQAVRRRFRKDSEYGYRHVATLSGGLDSRMNVMAAQRLGFGGQLNVTFAQSGSPDEVIARSIASDLGNELFFHALDGGDHLRETIGEAVALNGGLVFYAGAAHALAAYREMDFEGLGLMHTGQLGDAVFGSYLSRPARVEPRARSAAYSERLLDKTASVVEGILGSHASEETFKLLNRGFNGIVNGDLMAGRFTVSSSPFLDRDFLPYVLSIPPRLRYREKIYRDWILERYPDVARYPWAATGAELSTREVVIKARQLVRLVRSKLLGPAPGDSMTPFAYWYRNNRGLRDYVEGYYRRKAPVLDGHPELQRDCGRLFHQGSLLEKTQVMTLLEALELGSC